MFLENIGVQSFRNIDSVNHRFDSNLNIIFGENAQGKTSVLEAIYFLALTKSFRTNTEKFVLKKERKFFDLQGTFLRDDQISFQIRLYFSEAEGKHVFYNENKINKFSEIIGTVPIVLLSLEDLDISYGIPARRRRFIDILLSQINPLYLQALQKYRKSLLQRNKLLKDIKEKSTTKESLFPWDEQLAESGSYILLSRLKLVEFLNHKMSVYYDKISEKNETIQCIYRSSILKNYDELDNEEIESRYMRFMKNNSDRDVDMQTTLNGPHRDDLEFYKDELQLKSFGSQGENKTFLVALKFAESDYLKMNLNKKPILLMDDIFGELDNNRITNLMNFIKNIGQAFITTTIKEKFVTLNAEEAKFYKMKNGCLYET